MDQQFQTAIKLLTADIKQKEIERDAHLVKVRQLEVEIMDAKREVSGLQGKTRKERADKGTKRVNGKSHQKVYKKGIKLKRGRVKQTEILNEYDLDATFRQKVVFAITLANRFVHNREIGEILHKQEPSIPVDVWVQRLSSRASRLIEDKAFVNYLVDNNVRNTFYGLSQWKDEQGKIKKGYEYKTKHLVGKQAGNLMSMYE